MPLIGADTLVLPPTAGIEKAFAEVVVVPAPAPTATVEYVVSGNWYEVIVSINGAAITSAAAGIRTVALIYRDASGNAFEFINPPGTQGPSLFNNYEWMLGFSNSVGKDDGNKLGPLPPVLMLPGYKVQVAWNPFAAGDAFSAFVFYVQRYPTGPRADLEPQLALAPTPRLV